MGRAKQMKFLRKKIDNSFPGLQEGMTEEEKDEFNSLETREEKIDYALELLGFNVTI